MSEVRVEVHSGIYFDSEPARLVEVALTYGDQRRDVILGYDAKPQVVEFASDENTGRTIGVRYTAYMHSSRPRMQSFAPSYTSAEEKTEASIVVVDPRQVYRVESPRAFAMFPFEKYSAAFVDVRATDRASGSAIATTLELNPDLRQAEGALVMDRSAQIDLEYRVRHVAASGGLIEGPWLPLEAGAIVVSEPALAGL